MANYPHIERYQKHLDELREFGGYSEQHLRPAFQNCLDSYCRDRKERLMLVPELAIPSGVRPDGTVKDSLRMARGYWEAKDTSDDLDAEIQKKFNSGYPRDNIVFEDTETAVLVQNGEVAMRVDMRRPGELHRLIKHFLDYELPEIEEFRKAREQFKEDLPTVLKNLRATIEEADASNSEYRQAAGEFLNLCRQTIGPDVSEGDMREMLLQHILTKDIFLNVFADTQFHSENSVAKQLDSLEKSFFTGAVKHEAIDRLHTYYGAIGRAAFEIADYSEKQKFIKAIYEDFYKVYNPKAADRLGVVYTPNEVVDFMIRGTDHLLRKHFGRGLEDENVQILDPATGTGTFITNLINFLPVDKLEHKYLHEIHANEVAILPYYIANLNIEYTYKERMGRYLEFPNLCFVDTLDNMGWQQAGATGGAVQRQGALNLGGLSVENWVRIQEQNEKTVSVIIGNPPYNANQRSWNDFNPNRNYPEIDKRIRDTYVLESTAHKTKQYDMYKRFIRWASDRLADDGIVAFVSNSAFLGSRQDDGFRKIVAEEFNELWTIDLKGNARTSGERRRQEGGNIFEDKIRVGVAIYFLIRKKGAEGFKVFYNAVDDYEKAPAKSEYIHARDLTTFNFFSITPDTKNYWLNQSDSDFDALVPLARKKLSADLTRLPGEKVFDLYSTGVVTNRDGWVYDFSVDHLSTKVTTFIDIYEQERSSFGGKEFDDTVLSQFIKWTPDLIRQLRSNLPQTFRESEIRQTVYRPFVTKFLYFNKNLNWSQYQLPQIFPSSLPNQNRVIAFSGTSSSSPFSVLATDRIFGLDILEKTQSLPLYRFSKDGKRVTNITDWGLKQFRDHYSDHAISPEDIFAYTYAVLHDPEYRQKYAIDLLREFPGLPFYPDFQAWAEVGQSLLDLHIGFESAELYPLEREDANAKAGKPRLSAVKERGQIVLDHKTTLTGVPDVAWEYMLGNRSAIEWVLDQYKERKPRDPTIAERFNTYRFADYKEQVIDLLRRVCTVSKRTMELIDTMPARSVLIPTER